MRLVSAKYDATGNEEGYIIQKARLVIIVSRRVRFEKVKRKHRALVASDDSECEKRRKEERKKRKNDKKEARSK